MTDDPGGDGAIVGWLKTDFGPGALGSTLVIAVVLGLVNALLTVALVSLIFRGELSESLPVGIGLGLVSSAVLGFVVAMRSSFPGVYAGVQDASAAIIGLGAVSISAALVGDRALSTVVAMLAVTSLATGLLLLAMGYLKWGEVARFVPFPVIGALLAGTGYLILTGALGILDVDSVSGLASPDALGLIWPAVGLAVAFFVSARRGWGSRSYLVFLVVAVGGFHLVTSLAGTTRAASLERGWLLGPFPDGGLWPGSVLTSLADTDWAALAGELGGLVTILLVIPITLLLYISALEIETKADVDMNRELAATVWGNIAAGLVGGPPGYIYLADTVITSKLLGRKRGPAVLAPLVVLGVVALGGAVLEWIPQFVIGGMLLFVGAEFAYEWLWVSRRRMSVADYALMWGIVIIIATVGFLNGVVVGLIAATLLFVLRYSRIDVVKRESTAADRRSNIERSLAEADYLRDNGATVLVLELQGFIFFGTASRILGRVRAKTDEPVAPQYVVMDFKRVTGVDSSAVAVFERVALLGVEKDLTLVITGQTDTQSSQFEDLITAYSTVIEVQPDLDHGLAWCEDRVLGQAGVTGQAGLDRLDGLVRDLAPYLVERRFSPGEVLMRRGDPSPGIYLIRSGRATVLLDGDDGTPTRLRTLLSGTVLGEISLYREEPCTATVVAEDDAEVLHLSPERFADVCRDDPRVAAELHAFVARVLAGRVSHSNQAIRILGE